MLEHEFVHVKQRPSSQAVLKVSELSKIKWALA